MKVITFKDKEDVRNALREASSRGEDRKVQSLRITPTSLKDMYFVNELVKVGGKWINIPKEGMKAVSVRIDEHTTVFELIAKLEN